MSTAALTPERAAITEKASLMISGQLSESADMQSLLEEVDAVRSHMAEIGTIPATIINLGWQPVKAQGVLTSRYEVPACGEGVPYVVFHMPDPYLIDTVDKGGGYTARPVTAISLARDFVEQQRRYNRGGVFCYLGNHRPGENPDPKKAKEELAMLSKAQHELVNYYEKLVNEANSEWAKPNKSLSMIDDRHRIAARYLMHYKRLKVEPAWLTILRPEADVPESCPKCKSEVNKGAAECSKCAYALDPSALYEMGEIDENNMALRRLTRAQLDKLGLEHIQTLAETRGEKAEHRSEKKAKPPKE